jgi:chromate transporter
LKLGTIGFGGPAAHIALMEEEVVARRGWLTREHYLDLVGATNLIPGPNSTEMAIHVGYVRAGWPGLLVAGAAFILPAVLITSAAAWAYVEYGSLPQVSPLLYGIKPVVVAVILGAVWRLGRSAVKGWRLLIIGLAVVAAVLLGVNEIVALLLGGVLGMFWLRLAAGGATGSGGMAALLALPALPALVQPGGPAGVRLWDLALFFLKIGSVLYGSGYVLVAFLEGGLVRDLGWLTQQQLLDAIALGQFTPGPVLSTATFVGYVLAGVPGAVVATLGIFAPSFLFVAILNPVVPRLRGWPWTAAFLDAVNVSAIGLMVAVVAELAASTLTGWPAWVLAVSAAVAAVWWRVNPAWLVVGGAVLGWVFAALGFVG